MGADALRDVAGRCTADTLPRAIAFYLPQFHPIAENDAWWGKGFTEWTNVTKARPLFSWHNQPHLPADLGFYDLRLPEVREAQAALAQQYGIHGFCYYHYWFGGKRLLERPFHEVLHRGSPNFPFCLCWANENWTRAWDGGEREILMPQSYSPTDDLEHIRWLCRAFQDPRYIRVRGRPLFLVYRVSALPDPPRTAQAWREEARKLGVGEVFLCHVQSFPSEYREPEHFGFDAAVEFQPDGRFAGRPMRRSGPWKMLRKLRLHDRRYDQVSVYDYRAVAERMARKPVPSYPRFPCVTPGWDNTARRKRGGVILKDSTPDLYAAWLTASIERFLPTGSGDDIVFINAWNEWAEGNHLEPCQRWGRAYLEATQRALQHALPPKPAFRERVNCP